MPMCRFTTGNTGMADDRGDGRKWHADPGIMLAALNSDFQCVQYIFKRKPNGVNIINLCKT